MTSNKPIALYVLDDRSFELIYPSPLRDELSTWLDIRGHVTASALQADPSLLTDVEVILSGWGMVRLEAELLSHAPQLKIVFYGAGSVRGFVTPECWQQGIRVTHAASANGEPVAEYTLATILLSLKQFWHYASELKQGRDWNRARTSLLPVGTFHSVVGLISFGVIAQRVARLLQAFDVRVQVYDPYVDPAKIEACGATRVELSDIFEKSDVVSLHTPLLPETRGWLGEPQLAAMKPHATFINTSRGAIVREPELVEVLRKRPDLTAILDVTDPEPPPPNSPLYDLPNVHVTPHIAGSTGLECARMGYYMLEEVKRYLSGENLRYEVTEAMMDSLA